jgi:hypothetical protein
MYSGLFVGHGSNPRTVAVTHASKIAERISHSHPALTVGGATRIPHHCETCGDRDAAVALYLLTCLGRYRTDLPSSAGRPFSATHFLGRCFGLVPASCSFAACAFAVPLLHRWVPFDKAAARFGSQQPLASGCPKKMGQKKEIQKSYLYVKWNNFGAVCSPTVWPLKHVLRPSGPLPGRKPATP